MARYVANPVLVDALVIQAVSHADPDDGTRLLKLSDGSDFIADAGMLARMVPGPGDYVVTQADGYVYLNPGDVFERKYRLDDDAAIPVVDESLQTFGWAIKQLHNGSAVARAGWNGKGMWLKLQVPDAHSKMSLPYIYMKTEQGDLVPWLASQTDVLATDWEMVVEHARPRPRSQQFA